MKIHEDISVITYAFVDVLVREYYEEGLFNIHIFAHPDMINSFVMYNT